MYELTSVGHYSGSKYMINKSRNDQPIKLDDFDI